MELNVWISLAAGFLSFISPCCLPLYPSYLSYVTGVSVGQLKEGAGRRDVRQRVMTHTLFFIIGFSVIFYALGATAGLIAELFTNQRVLIQQIAGILVVVFGLFMLGIFQPQFLLRERKFQIAKPAGYLGSFLVGVGFAAGWSPCIGPILGAIMSLAASETGIWLTMTTAYTLGFAVPFFIMAFFLGSTRWLLRYSNLFMKIGGGVMVVIGVLLYLGEMAKITAFLNSITPDWLKF